MVPVVEELINVRQLLDKSWSTVFPVQPIFSGLVYANLGGSNFALTSSLASHVLIRVSHIAPYMVSYANSQNSFPSSFPSGLV